MPHWLKKNPNHLEHNLTQEKQTSHHFWRLCPASHHLSLASPTHHPRLIPPLPPFHRHPPPAFLLALLGIHVDCQFAAGVCERCQRKVSADSKLWCTKPTTWPPVIAGSIFFYSLCIKKKTLFRVRGACLVFAVQHCVSSLWGNQIVTPQLCTLMVSPGGVYAAGLLVAMAKPWVGQSLTEFARQHRTETGIGLELKEQFTWIIFSVMWRLERQVTFRCPQNVSGASQQNGVEEQQLK